MRIEPMLTDRLFDALRADRPRGIRDEDLLQGVKGPGARLVARSDPTNSPLSFQQEFVWRLHELEPDNTFYNIPPMAIRLAGELDIESLEAALADMSARHDVLRTRIEDRDGEARQVVSATASIPITMTDLSELPKGEQDYQARTLIRREAARPFDLTKGPLVRVGVVKLDAKTHLLLFTLHHIISDLWSFRLFARELAQAYSSRRHGEAPEFPRLPIQYGDYARWQREYVRGEVLRSHLEYWSPRLANLPRHRPPAIEAGDERSGAAGVSVRTVPRETVAALATLARRYGVTVYVVLLTAFKLLQYRVSGERDVVVASTLAHRLRPETEGLIGYFAVWVALRTTVSDTGAFEELLHRVAETCYGAHEHQYVPLMKLAEWLPDHRFSGTPVYRTVFAYQDSPIRLSSFAGLALRPYECTAASMFGPVGLARSLFDMRWEIWKAGDEYVVTLLHRLAACDRAAADRMMSEYVALLGALGADSEVRMSALCH